MRRRKVRENPTLVRGAPSPSPFPFRLRGHIFQIPNRFAALAIGRRDINVTLKRGRAVLARLVRPIPVLATIQPRVMSGEAKKQKLMHSITRTLGVGHCGTDWVIRSVMCHLSELITYKYVRMFMSILNSFILCIISCG